MAYKKFTPRKTTKKIYKKVYGSRTVPQAVSATGKVARDVLALTKTVGMLASRLNVEKKNQTVDVITAQVGQVFDSSTGNLLADITPAIAQGVNSNQRIGNSLKMTGMNFPIQFSSQSSCFASRRIRVELFRVLDADNSVTASTIYNDYYDPNPLNGLRDMNAPLKYSSQKQNGIKRLRVAYYNLKSPQLSITGDGETACLSVNFSVKLQDILRYDSGTNTQPDGTRYFIAFTCDAGNAGTATSTADVPVKSSQTGVQVRLGQKYWWVDN